MWSKSLIKIIVTFDADGYCYNGQNNTNYQKTCYAQTLMLKLTTEIVSQKGSKILQLNRVVF